MLKSYIFHNKHERNKNYESGKYHNMPFTIRQKDQHASGESWQFFLVINEFQRWPYIPPSIRDWTQGGPIASRGRSVSVFLRKPIATCDFQGGGGLGLLSPSLDPPMKACLVILHALLSLTFFKVNFKKNLSATLWYQCQMVWI